MLYKRQERGGGLAQSLRRGMPPKGKYEWRKPRQHPQVVANLGRPVQAVAQDGSEVSRKRVGNDAGALNQPSVSEARLLAWAAAIQEYHIEIPRVQMERRRYAYDAGAKDDSVRSHQSKRAIVTAGTILLRSMPSSNDKGYYDYGWGLFDHCFLSYRFWVQNRID